MDEFAVGDRIAWWEDAHGRGLPSDHPDAIRRAGAVDWVMRSSIDETTIVAYSVIRTSNIGGRYLVTVRPDLGHRPVPDTDAGAE